MFELVWLIPSGTWGLLYLTCLGQTWGLDFRLWNSLKVWVTSCVLTVEGLKVHSESTGLAVAFATLPTHVWPVTGVCPHMSWKLDGLSKDSLTILAHIHLSWNTHTHTNTGKNTTTYAEGKKLNYSLFSKHTEKKRVRACRCMCLCSCTCPTFWVLLLGVVWECSSHTEAHVTELTVVWFLSCVQPQVIF